jgi:hypothetical protein
MLVWTFLVGCCFTCLNVFSSFLLYFSERFQFGVAITIAATISAQKFVFSHICFVGYSCFIYIYLRVQHDFRIRWLTFMSFNSNTTGVPSEAALSSLPVLVGFVLFIFQITLLYVFSSVFLYPRENNVRFVFNPMLW